MTHVVVIKIAAMFLVIVVGWLARKRGFLADEFTAILSRLVVDVAFPALVFTQMLRTVDAAALREIVGVCSARRRPAIWPGGPFPRRAKML